MIEVPPAAVAAFFAPERPGPIVHAHIAATGIGRCRADHRTAPRTALAEVTGNLACRGEPAVVTDLRGFVEAPPEWLPALREVDPDTAVWERVVAVLPDSAEPPAPARAARRLGAADAAALGGIEPSIAWIHSTWGGPAALAASGYAWAAWEDDRVVSVACSFLVGRAHEDIGVVTDPAHRGRGLSTACAAALIADIRSRGRRASWTTSPDNAGSRAVAARLGFRHVRDDVLYAVHTPIPV
ncbi:MAG TPA: GNAT family N-acetyltransferase [Pseudonocardia sp.]|nr:GNAT family N-acetyltransferase [Pseudonocardia sp.]